MALTNEQMAVFQKGSGISPEQLNSLIVGIIAAAIFLWSAWVAFSYLQQWREGKNRVTLYDVGLSFIRAIFIVSIILYLIN